MYISKEKIFELFWTYLFSWHTEYTYIYISPTMMTCFLKPFLSNSKVPQLQKLYLFLRSSFWILWFISHRIHVSDQIIATSHDLTPNGGLVREIPLFQETPGWWNIIFWPEGCKWSIFSSPRTSQCSRIWPFDLHMRRLILRRSGTINVKVWSYRVAEKRGKHVYTPVI